MIPLEAKVLKSPKELSKTPKISGCIEVLGCVFVECLGPFGNPTAIFPWCLSSVEYRNGYGEEGTDRDFLFMQSLTASEERLNFRSL